jgi:hypothetical protein
VERSKRMIQDTAATATEMAALGGEVSLNAQRLASNDSAAEKKMVIADNFWGKQQKQREPHTIARFVHLTNEQSTSD